MSQALRSRGRGDPDRYRLAPPVHKSALIDRQLVLRSLAAARTGRMTLLIAPPGFGKTTVLAQWQRQLLGEGVAVAWYSASERDREPFAFVRMLVKALSRAGVDMKPSGFLDTFDADPNVMLDAILLALELHNGDVVLMLDEFERVESAEVNAIVEALLQTASENTHIAIATRRKPRLAVSALLTQGGVRIFEANELCLTARELGVLMDLPVDSAEIEVIAQRTQGWPVAAELYRLWRENGHADAELSALFLRSDELADYLTEHVFALLSQEHQALLADISILKDIQTELVDAIRDRTDSALLLNGLARALPGLVQMAAGASETYRIHPLLLDHSRPRFKINPARERLLHRRAADWFERGRRYAEAIEHAHATGQAEIVDRLLARLKPLHIFLDVGSVDMRAVMRRITPEQIAEHPRLQLMAALAHLKSGFFSEAKLMLDGVRERTSDFRVDPRGHHAQLELEGRALELVFAGYIHGARANAEPMAALVAGLAQDDPLMWAWCENIMVVIYEARGQFAASRAAIARTRAVYESNGLTRFACVNLPIHEALVALGQGLLRTSADFALGSRQLRVPPTSGIAHIVALSRMVINVIDYEHRFVEVAVDAARNAFDTFGEAETWAEPAMILYVPAAEVAIRREGASGLDRLIQDARARAKRVGMTAMDDFLVALETASLLRLGECDAAGAGARRLMAVREGWSQGAPSSWRERDLTNIALWLWFSANTDFDGAHIHAEALVDEGIKGGRLRTQIKGWTLKALGAHRANDRRAAIDAACTALELGRAEAFVAPFAEEGEALRPLMDMISRAEDIALPIRRHADLVLKALNLGQRRPDDLNEREAEILAHLMDGASNKLIARRIGVTDNTVKFHLKKIFAKLGVTSRKAAAAAARERSHLAGEGPLVVEADGLA